MSEPKNKHAQALGRLGGKAGKGTAVRSEVARKAALARWARVGQGSESAKVAPVGLTQ